MASVNVYLVGPPVRHSSDIKDLLKAMIIDKLGHGFRDFAIREMRGPVPFRSSWILESGVRHVKRRPGLHCVDLWCVVCVWPPPYLDQPPWSVIVQDSERDGRHAPSFETFLVTQPNLGRVGPSQVSQRLVRIQPAWTSRCYWHDRLEQTQYVRQQDAARARASLTRGNLARSVESPSARCNRFSWDRQS